MKPVEVTQSNLNEVLDREGIVVLDWWAPWCGPCKSFAPVFEKVAEKHPDVAFGKVNTESEPGLAATFQIKAIPTLMLLRDRVLLFSQPGAMPETALEHLIAQARSLDMEQVRAELEAAAQEHSEAESTPDPGAQPTDTSSK